jgi:hypothetical protein
MVLSFRASRVYEVPGRALGHIFSGWARVRNRDFRASFEQLRAGRGVLEGLYPFWLESQSRTRFHLRPILSLLRFRAFMTSQS